VTTTQRKLWSVFVHVLAIAAGLALGVASYHWVAGT
jgi:TRAP-type C4-dicarboxylate transport system permease small subunit